MREGHRPLQAAPCWAPLPALCRGAGGCLPDSMPCTSPHSTLPFSFQMDIGWARVIVKFLFLVFLARAKPSLFPFAEELTAVSQVLCIIPSRWL